MATLSRSFQLLAAAVLLVATFVSIVESSRNTRPFQRARGGSRHFGNSRFGTEGRERSQDGFQKAPGYHHSAAEPPLATMMKNTEGWFKNYVASKRENPNPSPEHSSDDDPEQEKVVVRPPIIRKGSIVTSPTITMVFLETIDVRKRNSSRVQQPTNPERSQEEAVTNEATTLPSNSRPSRRAFTADEIRIQCGGPNEAGQTEECYRFELPAELNNNAIIISGAVVLLPAGNGFPDPNSHGNMGRRSSHHNVTIVAKFPTTGEDAYRESISVQNISCDIPWRWKSASLPQGSSLVSRALQEGNTLVLKVSIITNENGHPTTTNFIPMESNMLPVLVVDIEFNGTDSSTTSSTTTTATFRTSQANVVERRLRRRRTLARDSEDPITNVTCSGYPGCCRRTIDVSFVDLGWHWIISPRRVTMSFCVGYCLAPHVTFESFMLDLIQGHHPLSSDNLTCHPALTRHFEALMMNEDGTFQAIRLQNFIVKECACAEIKERKKTKIPPEAPTGHNNTAT